MIQTEKAQRKASGAHYTPPELARFVAKRLASACLSAASSRKLDVLDPAVGDGELLVALIQEFSAAGVQVASITGYDTDPVAIRLATSRLQEAAPDMSVRMIQRDFLASAEPVHLENHSLFDEPAQLFDVVITNPPYVRTQVLGAQTAQVLARRFGLRGRLDLSHAFVRLYASVLRKGGVLGAILSNRFMTTRAGAEVRAFIQQNLPPVEIWDLGDTRLFDAAVLPSVVIARNGRSRTPDAPSFTSVYQRVPTARSVPPAAVIGSLEGQPSDCLVIKRGRLATGDSLDGVWRVETSGDAAWLSTVARNTALVFKDVGPIRVGIKTTADSIFIADDWRTRCGGEEPELIRPLVTHREANPIRPRRATTGRSVLYTHEIRDGKRRAVELEHFPVSAKYLAAHREQLESRSYVREAGRAWFEIWVPQDPAAWELPKVVFRDISDVPTFWLGEAGAVVNGDCYWIAPEREGAESLLWLLLGVANSTFALAFYDRRFQNRLYAGRRRFMTQYVSEFPLPDPGSEAAEQIIAEVQRLYFRGNEVQRTDLVQLDRLVYRAFGLDIEEVGR
jgi:hypothetical protein